MPSIRIQQNKSNFAEIDAIQGASLSRLVLDGIDLIKFPLKSDDPKKGYPSSFLFPFPNRIKDGKYKFEGKEYQLPINDPEFNHAIHGLLAFEPFEEVKSQKNAVELMYKYKGDIEGYPFPYDFRVKFHVSNSCLKINIKFKNTGKTNMPVGFGWHPYFGFGDNGVGSLSLSIPDRKKILLSDRVIPTGDKEFEAGETISLKNNFVDNLYEVENVSEKHQIKLHNSEKTITVTQETGEKKLNYFILYIPPSRDCIAIEPQSASTNAFNNLDGLAVVGPKESHEYDFSVEIENINPI